MFSYFSIRGKEIPLITNERTTKITFQMNFQKNTSIHNIRDLKYHYNHNMTKISNDRSRERAFEGKERKKVKQSWITAYRNHILSDNQALSIVENIIPEQPSER